MKSIEEIVSMEETKKHQYYPVNFNNLNIYMRTTKPDEISKESLESFFGDNLYYPNKNNEFLTHILAGRAFRQGLTPEKTVKLFKIIYEMLDPNLPGGNYGKASITTFFTETPTYMLTKHDLEFGLDFFKFIYRMNIQNGFDINYTDARNLHFIAYVKIVDKFLSLIYKEYEKSKISPKFSYLNYIKDNLNNQEIIFSYQDFHNDYEIAFIDRTDIIELFSTKDFDYDELFGNYSYNNKCARIQNMERKGQLYQLKLKKIRKEMENE